MIGGYDVVLKMTRRTDDFDTVVTFLRKMWPQGAYQSVNDERCYVFAESKTLPRENEFFVYRDKAAFQQIDDEGVTEELAPLMVHVLLGSDGITYVVDEEDSALHRQVKGLEQALKNKRNNG